jgi:hypothetical protein
MREHQTTIYDVIFDEDRDLHKEEYANLRAKQKDGHMNADFFRRNMFNATARGGMVQYKRPKVVWESPRKSVAISHSLHQRHADVLSLMHTDCLGVSKPNKDGSYEIYLSLYRIAKLMGYKNPASSADKVKQFIADMRWTDFIVTDEDGEYGDTILGKYRFSETKDVFVVKINALSAKILAHTTGIKLEKELAHKIVAIPNKLSKLKAMVRYIIASEKTTHGYKLETIFEKFGIGQSGSDSTRLNQKSDFRKQLRENKDLLDIFNLKYEAEKQKIYYTEQLKEVTFELPIKTKRIHDKITEVFVLNPYADMINKKIKIQDIIYEIIEVIDTSNDDKVDVKLLNIYDNKLGIAKAQSITNIRNYIEECNK